MNRIGILGCGKLGESILRGLLSKSVYSNKDILCSVRTPQKCDNLKNKYRISCYKSQRNNKLIKSVDLLIVAVKPIDIWRVFLDMNPLLQKRRIPVIVTAAGVPIHRMRAATTFPLVRAMPNTASSLGCGITTISTCSDASSMDLEYAKYIFSHLGQVLVVDDKTMNTTTALGASGPAFMFSILESMITTSISLGLSRKEAQLIAAQAMKGAGEMVLQSKKTPVELIKDIATPGGCTAVGIEALQPAHQIIQDVIKNTVRKLS